MRPSRGLSWLICCALAFLLVTVMFALLHRVVDQRAEILSTPEQSNMQLSLHPSGLPCPENLYQAYESARQCKADSDCIVFGGYCPIGCDLAINRLHEEKFRQTLRRNEQHGCQQCVFRCRPNAANWASCIDGVCQRPFVSADREHSIPPRPERPNFDG